MTNIEISSLESIKYNLPAMVKELAKMNKLKALELKMACFRAANGGYPTDCEDEIDEIMKG